MSLLQVFEDTQPVVISVLDGYNVCIFAYGQVRDMRPVTAVFAICTRLLVVRSLIQASDPKYFGTKSRRKLGIQIE